MNYVRTHRHLCNPKTTEDLLRIRYNGPPIQKFDVKRYARLWVSEHYYTDQQVVKSPQKLQTNEIEEDVDEIIHSDSTLY